MPRLASLVMYGANQPWIAPFSGSGKKGRGLNCRWLRGSETTDS